MVPVCVECHDMVDRGGWQRLPSIVADEAAGEAARRLHACGVASVAALAFSDYSTFMESAGSALHGASGLSRVAVVLTVKMAHSRRRLAEAEG